MAKRKLLTFLTIFSVILLSGCKKEITQSTFQPIIEDLDWGMGESQVINILNSMKDMDYMQYDDDSNADNQENNNEGNTLLSFIELNSPIKKFGYNARVVLAFVKEGYDGLEEDGLLCSIALGYSDVTEEELLAQLKSELGDNYRESVLMTGFKSYIWESKNKMKDLPKETFDELYTFLKSKAPNSESLILPKIDDPVNRIILRVSEEDSGTSLVVTYKGDWEWMINYLNNMAR
ncbi:MAG TPA: hypothetical protein VHQ24_08255 [Lachnospiraceae bacterium]|nr:hypothetical protein [Lachnospiraceae bacterium]